MSTKKEPDPEKSIFGLDEIGERIRTQDNLATGEPIFLVQQKRREYWIEPGSNDEAVVVWLSEGGEVSLEDSAELDTRYLDDGTIPEGFWRTGYIDRWEFVTPCFTRVAAQRYIDENAHNLTEPRIYVETAYRNNEWIAIRKALSDGELALVGRYHAALEFVMRRPTWTMSDPAASTFLFGGVRSTDALRAVEGAVESLREAKEAGDGGKCPTCTRRFMFSYGLKLRMQKNLGRKTCFKCGRPLEKWWRTEPEEEPSLRGNHPCGEGGLNP